MTEEYAQKGLVTERQTAAAYITVPVKYLEMVEKFYLFFFSNEVNDISNSSLNVNNASLIAYQQRWEAEITSRFREAKKRFAEFFPCFKLLESPGKGWEYSIHFEPLTGHAKALIEQTPLFPHQEEFKPIEKLWQEDGSSELDILFQRFPTQSALSLPKKRWGTRWWTLLLGFVKQGHFTFLTTHERGF